MSQRGMILLCLHISAPSPEDARTRYSCMDGYHSLVETGSAFLRMFSEAAVLFRVLRQQGDGSLLVLASRRERSSILLGFQWGSQSGR